MIFSFRCVNISSHSLAFTVSSPVGLPSSSVSRILVYCSGRFRTESRAACNGPFFKTSRRCRSCSSRNLNRRKKSLKSTRSLFCPRSSRLHVLHTSAACSCLMSARTSSCSSNSWTSISPSPFVSSFSHASITCCFALIIFCRTVVGIVVPLPAACFVSLRSGCFSCCLAGGFSGCFLVSFSPLCSSSISSCSCFCGFCCFDI
mmetsp:Transcript_14245/g.28404  ORF Transcript_14245/g.28404 Transcript_14245/m.28404 type:complete len:203 (+) Transcript_14245:1846-2454(+)